MIGTLNFFISFTGCVSCTESLILHSITLSIFSTMGLVVKAGIKSDDDMLIVRVGVGALRVGFFA